MPQTLETLEKLVAKINDPVLKFLAITVSFVAVAIVVVQGKEMDFWEILGVMGMVVFVVLAGITIRYVFDQRSSSRQFEERENSLQNDLETKDKEMREWINKFDEVSEKLAAPPISVIHKRDYAQLIKKWNDSGEGHLLLFNIEMQSFQTDLDIQRTWGTIADLTNIKNVVLLLPERKVQRWERVVRMQASRFFEERKYRKFLVCGFDTEQVRDVASSHTIGFALYRYGDNPGNGRLHGTALVFVMSGPFSQLREPRIPEDDPWWDYQHIIKFDNDHVVVTNMEQAWRQCFDETRTRDVSRVIEDTRPLQPIKPSVLFDKLGVTPLRKLELMDNFTDRRQVRAEPAMIPSGDKDRSPFTINYNNNESIQGHYRGAEELPKQALVWVGSFTERQGTKLPALFERTLKNESVVQFYYAVSPPIEFITPTRYRQDMREVLHYVQRQRAVEPNKTVLIARSVNGLLAALVASEPEFLQQLSGLILVAPVFDLIKMIDNYRATREEKKKHVRVEKCWRATPGYTADKWEDPENGWLEFFGHHISLTLFADIIQHDPEEFSIQALKRAIGIVSQQCPVFILSNSDDPVTGSREALKILGDAASGTGLIRDENYKHVEINSSHYTEVDRDKYPFAPRQEVRETRTALRAILDRLGVPIANEETEESEVEPAS